ncbi:MAG: glycine--tRNA ligase subunit beta [Bryobacteraceae bacterium]|nr:glycine--tRNA ligase subunit beta [Bryobacterales bacterium]NUN01443.1 glycine--tRNA ligase subunit beta [Bryobacteraceae bacterium]
MRLPFLLEIGTEEIPDWMIEPALKELAGSFSALLSANGLSGAAVAVEATPRRLTLRADRIPDRQPDSVEAISGPPKSAGDTAAAGFARKAGVSVQDLEVVTTPKGEYFQYKKRIEGRRTIDIFAGALPGLILGIPWPKTMYWTGKAGPRFIRPIRWLVSLLGKDVVPFEIAGVSSGNITSGHRRLGKKTIRITCRSYPEMLRKNYVLISAAERREKIETGIAGLLEGTGLRVKKDAALLHTLAFMTEYPAPILGRFDESYLRLPEEVLVTVMRHHQRYFSVEDASGALAPHFIAVMNTSADADGLVQAGNERVLKARFNDAAFFWTVDQQKKLCDRIGDLANVTFQTKLGSYKDKTERVVQLVRDLGGPETAIRAAELSKCDLTTGMVKEFTELQGVVGGLYARVQGEGEEVALAIYEHYKPVSMEDAIPGSPDGRLVSLADKLETLRGCFGIGLIPTGSGDPFALRRAAQGVIRILVEGRCEFSLRKLAAGDETLLEFLLDRARYYFRDVKGFKYDEVNAVLAAGYDDLVDAASRLEAIQRVRPTENFEPLAASFKRIQNILRQAGSSVGYEFRPELLEAGPERDLYEEFERVRSRVQEHRENRAYLPALETIASLRPKVDLFFDKVLVNAPDPEIRRNRLALLHNLLTEFSAIADFSEIVTS